MSTTLPPRVPQGAVPAIGVPNSQDYPRLVFTAPYFETVPLAELIEPSVIEAVESALPALVPPYVQDAANIAVAQQAVLLAGSTMNGPLFLNPVLPTQPAQAASMAYVDLMVSTAGIPEVPPVPQGQTWARQTGQWVPVDPTGGTALLLSGGTMQGAINMNGNSITNLPAVPTLPNGAAPAQWVLNQLAAVSLYQGTWDADNNTPDLTQPGTHQNGFTWIALTASPSGVVISPPIPGLQGMTVFNGDTIIFSALTGTFSSIHAGGLTLPEAQALFVQLTGSQMSGPLMLNANASSAMQATPLQQVQALVAGAGLGEAPTDGQLYGRSGATQSWLPVLSLAGGVLTGALTLNGNAVANLNPVPLQQLTTSLANYVPIAGGATMTGPLTMGSAATLTLNGNAAASLQAVPFQQLLSTLQGYVPLTGNVTMTGPLTLSGNATTALQSAPLQQVQAVSGENVGRNLLHNGLFNIQQRGQGTWSGNSYTADRWQLQPNIDTSTVQLSPLSDANRVSIGDEAAQWCLYTYVAGNAAATALTQIGQPIENLHRLAGKTVTVSFWAASGVVLSLGVRLAQMFGTGGSPSPDVNTPPQTVVLTANPVRYVLTFSLPSAAGKTLGTNGNDYTSLFFGMSSGATNSAVLGVGVQTGVIWLWGVQLEIGSVATPLEKLDPRLDLANCQRFYQVGQVYAGGYSAAAITAVVGTTFPVPMRVSPTITITTNGDAAITSPSQVGNAGFAYFQGITPAGISGWAINRVFTLSADL